MSERRFPYSYLFWELTRVEFKLRDQGTLFGFLWTLLHPAFMFVVLYMLFIKWLGRFVDQYAAYLLIGLVLWNFFQKSTSLGLSSLKRRAALLRNYNFPREIVVLSAVMAVFVSAVLEMAVLVPFLLLLGVRPSWYWLFCPLLVGLLLAIATALSLFLSVLAAEFHDMERIWDVLTTALFYLTPVFYPLTIVGGWKRTALEYNPLTVVMTNLRRCVLEGSAPALGEIFVVAGVSAMGVWAGLRFLRHRENRFVDELIV
ncbi:MAG: ABC transporter permease [Elusimicrobia bacterium]|nr:ABC transporter permease [Elusimicrobiota bacterium]